MTISVLIVGLGSIGMGYDEDDDTVGVARTHARAFAIHPSFRLVGGVDLDPGCRSRFRDAYAAPAFPSIGEAVRATAPDVVVVATPTDLHRPHLEEILQVASPRIILCEKPLASSSADAEAMVTRCREAGVTLLVNYMRRVDPAVRWLADAVAAGRVRLPCRGVCWYSKGLLHNGSHLFDVVAHVLGPPLRLEVLRPGRTQPFGPEPDLRVTFRGGDITFLAVPEEQFTHGSLALVAANGLWRYENWGEEATWEAMDDSAGTGSHGPAGPWVTGLSGIQARVAEALARFLDGAPVPLCTGGEAAEWVRWLTSESGVEEVLR